VRLLPGFFFIGVGQVRALPVRSFLWVWVVAFSRLRLGRGGAGVIHLLVRSGIVISKTPEHGHEVLGEEGYSPDLILLAIASPSTGMAENFRSASPGSSASMAMSPSPCRTKSKI